MMTGRRRSRRRTMYTHICMRVVASRNEGMLDSPESDPRIYPFYDGEGGLENARSGDWFKVEGENP
jgi:hypothetical protein